MRNVLLYYVGGVYVIMVLTFIHRWCVDWFLLLLCTFTMWNIWFTICFLLYMLSSKIKNAHSAEKTTTTMMQWQ